MTSTISLRPARESDCSTLWAIQCHYINNTKMRQSGLPYIVACDPSSSEPDKPIGSIYVSPFRGTRPGYKHTVEFSLFCAPDSVGRGVGSVLLSRLLEVLKHPENWGEEWISKRWIGEERVMQIIGVMALDGTGKKGDWALKEWYERFGFEQVGHLKKVGRKFGRWIDTVYLQLSL
ncbi:gnat family n-acetyltransferase [Moniliophthora roreri MCA 2997]|uniref:Gnat family n-acetyltransferase n=1 Tax=Moniliophthora roreri (strain MCA 2997) TaxID=1381753 RepID=V2WQF8_MONRO|nr:gnat family n-acetyltransferase [Moniliophthora roreri MCA 2997]